MASSTAPFRLGWDNLALRKLPIETDRSPGVRIVRDACFSRVVPNPVQNPRLVCRSQAALDLIGVTNETTADELAAVFSGNQLLEGSEPAAHCYCGYQFGSFAGQLGDGAAMYLGEVLSSTDERWEIQLKGAGLTPYSRQADGRKVLRSSLREFLASEALHFLGIPSTRAGTIVTSDSQVLRDQFYDGNPRREQCSIVLRIAPTFIRFGSFEICNPPDPMTRRSGPSYGRPAILRTLFLYVAETFYPELYAEHGAELRVLIEQVFQEVCRRTAHLVALWQCYGFCHGVLNTDNMSIIGVTIDYGPFGFLDRYDPDFVCNSSDEGGRYRFGKQPEICKWNCARLAEAWQLVAPDSDGSEDLHDILERIFDDVFQQSYLSKMRQRLGLLCQRDNDKELIDRLLLVMLKTGADYNNVFVCLSQLCTPRTLSDERRLDEIVELLLNQCASVDQLKRAYRPSMDTTQLRMLQMLVASNPSMGRMGEMVELELLRTERYSSLHGLNDETKRQRDRDLWTEWLSAYYSRLQLDREEDSVSLQAQFSAMCAANPIVVLRNHLAQSVIEQAKAGQFSDFGANLMAEIERLYQGSCLTAAQELFDQLCHPFPEPDGSLKQSSLTPLTESAVSQMQISEDAGPSDLASLTSRLTRAPDWSHNIRVS